MTIFSLTSLFKRLRQKVVASSPDTSTFVHNDRSQCLYCVLPIMRCAFGTNLDVGFTKRSTTVRFVGTIHVSLPLSREDGRLR